MPFPNPSETYLMNYALTGPEAIDDLPMTDFTAAPYEINVTSFYIPIGLFGAEYYWYALGTIYMENLDNGATDQWAITGITLSTRAVATLHYDPDTGVFTPFVFAGESGVDADKIYKCEFSGATIVKVSPEVSAYIPTLDFSLYTNYQATKYGKPCCNRGSLIFPIRNVEFFNFFPRYRSGALKFSVADLSFEGELTHLSLWADADTEDGRYNMTGCAAAGDMHYALVCARAYLENSGKVADATLRVIFGLIGYGATDPGVYELTTYGNLDYITKINDVVISGDNLCVSTMYYDSVRDKTYNFLHIWKIVGAELKQQRIFNAGYTSGAGTQGFNLAGIGLDCLNNYWNES